MKLYNSAKWSAPRCIIVQLYTCTYILYMSASMYINVFLSVFFCLLAILACGCACVCAVRWKFYTFKTQILIGKTTMCNSALNGVESGRAGVPKKFSKPPRKWGGVRGGGWTGDSSVKNLLLMRRRRRRLCAVYLKTLSAVCVCVVCVWAMVSEGEELS